MNMVVDGSRQKQFEMFLGLRRHKHLPTQPEQPLQVLTRPYAWILKPVPVVYPSLYTPQALLTGLPKGVSWVRFASLLMIVFLVVLPGDLATGLHEKAWCHLLNLA
jgi:hypothetical protein